MLNKEFLMEITSDIYLGDSKEKLKLISDNTVDLIVTSPPYADQRKTLMEGFTLRIMLIGFYQFPNNC